MSQPPHSIVPTAQDRPFIGDAAKRVSNRNWQEIRRALDAHGYAVLPGLASRAECTSLAELYQRTDLYRSKVIMARHGFGRGEYQYFRYPLPSVIQELRQAIYPHLAPIVNHWNQVLRVDTRYPADHEAFLRRCHDAGQTRPTPLILQYGPGDYNCLHQDLYGEHVFPLQAALLLSQPNDDFTGGEFVLTRQRSGHSPHVEVAPLEQGDVLIFTVNRRPSRGSRAYHRVVMRHGVSRIRSGRRHMLGIIFHDAE